MSETKHIETVTKSNGSLRRNSPVLNKDGGDIELIDVKENTVIVRLLGNCSSCHINTSTLKLGVENTIKQHVPEIVEVINID